MMRETLACMALLLAGSGAQDASRAPAPALPQTQAVQQQKQSNTATSAIFQITGRVVNSTTNAPVAGAYVVINSASAANTSRTVRAGTDGSFAFTQVPAGRYVLIARRNGYVEQTFLQHQQYTTAILVGPNLDSENLVFPLAPEGVISGEVTDEAGEPVQSAKMLLFREDNENGTHSKRLQKHENTDEEGRYRFGSLLSGTYYLAVAADPWYAVYARAYHSSWTGASGDARESESHGSGLDLVYPITYYPNATDVSGAASIRVETGSSARADIRLAPVPALHLRIEVEGEDNSQRYTQILVKQTILGSYQDASPSSSQRIVTERVPGDGDDDSSQQPPGPSFIEIGGLRPGPSVIEVVTGKPGETWQSSGAKKSIPVNVTDGQTLDVRGVAPTGVVSGVVKAEGNPAAPPGARVIVRNASKGTGFRADADPAGNFSFSSDEIEPGVYEIFAAAPGGLELRSVSANGTKMTGRKIEIGSGGDLQLVLTLARGVYARLKGIAERGGKPAPGMMVVLVPEDLRDISEYRRDQSDSDGSFSLNQVSPGKYTVIALSDWNLEWGNRR